MSHTTEIKVSEPQREILESSQPLNLFLAGAGSGKTFAQGVLSANFIINYPELRGFIGANTYGQLSKSTLFRIFNVWRELFGWYENIHYVVDKIPPENFVRFNAELKSYENTISFNNGCLIFLASLDNYKVIDGTEFCWAILDETKDTKEEAVKEVIMFRLRQVGLYVKEGELYSEEVEGSTGHNPCYIFTSPAKVAWLNEWFELGDHYEEINRKVHDKTDYFKLVQNGKKVVISSTYHNAENLPPGWIEKKISDLKGSPHLIDMLIFGSPVAKSGGEFFSAFDRLTHVGEVQYDPEANLHITLDFNVVPYITMSVWQIKQNHGLGKIEVNCIDEFALPSPKNKTEYLCQAFAEKYCKGKKHAGIFFYGDNTGKSGTTVSTEHNYDILERVLRPYLNDNSDRVIPNPRVSATRDFINWLLAEGTNIRIKISDKCKILIADLEFLKEAPDGGALKQIAKDNLTGGKYEKFGHMSDGMRYFLCSAFNALFEREK